MCPYWRKVSADIIKKPEMRSSGLPWGSQANDKCPYERLKRDRQGERATGRRAETGVTWPQGESRQPRGWKRQGAACPLEAFEGNTALPTL